jgi:hypothetical protein
VEDVISRFDKIRVLIRVGWFSGCLVSGFKEFSVWQIRVVVHGKIDLRFRAIINTSTYFSQSDINPGSKPSLCLVANHNGAYCGKLPIVFGSSVREEKQGATPVVAGRIDECSYACERHDVFLNCFRMIL